MDPALRELLDRQEIVAIQTRYGTALDDRDWQVRQAAEDLRRAGHDVDAGGDLAPS